MGVNAKVFRRLLVTTVYILLKLYRIDLWMAMTEIERFLRL